MLDTRELHQQVNIFVKQTYSFPSQMTSLLSAEVPVIQPSRCPQAASWPLLRASVWKMQNCSQNEANHSAGTAAVTPNIPSTGFLKCILLAVTQFKSTMQKKKIPKHPYQRSYENESLRKKKTKQTKLTPAQLVFLQDFSIHAVTGNLQDHFTALQHLPCACPPHSISMLQGHCGSLG